MDLILTKEKKIRYVIFQVCDLCHYVKLINVKIFAAHFIIIILKLIALNF